MQGDKAEAQRYVKRLLQMGVSVGCVTATAIFLGRNVLPQLFSPDPTVIAAAATALPVVAASMVRGSSPVCNITFPFLFSDPVFPGPHRSRRNRRCAAGLSPPAW